MRMRIDDIGKLVAAVAVTGAGILFSYTVALNSLIPFDVYTRLSCGQTIQQVKRDYYKQSPLFYYLEGVGRNITFLLKEPNPQKDESCFRNGKYNEHTPVRLRLF